MKEIQIHDLIPIVSVRTFVIPFYNGAGSVINCGCGFLTNYGSDSGLAKSYGSGSATLCLT
jgi:hypothetical protein